MLWEIFKSFGFAFKGIIHLFRAERNAKIHVIAAVLAISAGFFFEISLTEWCLIIISIVMVISAEGFNTAFEILTDLVSPDYHEKAGMTKDLAAGAVLMVAIGAAIVGLIIFGPKVIAYFLD